MCSHLIKNENAKLLRSLQRTLLSRTSPEVKCLHPTSSNHEMRTSNISNSNYHKFSHGAASYTLSGKSINVMLE